MKKLIGIMVVLVIAAFGISACGNGVPVSGTPNSNVSQNDTTTPSAQDNTTTPSASSPSPSAGQQEYISEADAKMIALEHAGVTEAEAQFVRVNLDKDDFRVVYEIEFYSSNMEYGYDIDATSGEIVEYDVER